MSDMQRSFFELACSLKGTCSPSAIYYGLKENPGARLSFLWSRVKRLYWWMRDEWRLRGCCRIWRKEIGALSRQMPDAKVGDFVKPLALYLPQYHTFPENDAWWGQGFTEWTNVRRATPLFEGHTQPHVPHSDVGYYDLSDVNVMRRQAAMAKSYGIAGFCFYYYHFAGGKRLLDKPLRNWLAAKDIEFPFCYAWANENWTRAWDGGDKEIIMPQDYDQENMRKMFADMLQDFMDPRYIKVGRGKNTPVLLVYRPEIIPKIAETVSDWRAMARKSGFDGLYLISMQNFCERDPREMQMDAACEFASFKAALRPLQRFPVPLARFVRNGHPLNVVSYAAVAYRIRRDRSSEYPRYKAAVPGWDNTARKAERGIQVVGATSERFESMLRDCALQTVGDMRLRENGFLFLNAWNEWGEGAHLEPDMRNGYSCLEAVRRTMELGLCEL